MTGVQTCALPILVFSCKGRGVCPSCNTRRMVETAAHLTVDAGVCIGAHDRAALERLLRYCARPPSAMERLRKEGAALVYRCAKQHSEPTGDKRGAKVDELHLTPLELIDRIAALVPPPRTHRHRYFGVLAPNSPLRAAVTVFVTPAQPVTVQAKPVITTEGATGVAQPAQPEPVPPKRSPTHCLWAVLIARIYEVFPLLCPMCGGQMRLIVSQSPRARRSREFWSTSAWTRSHRTSPRHAGHRCGMTVVMRRWARAWKPSRTGQLTGMGRRNRHRTLSINGSMGGRSKRRF